MSYTLSKSVNFGGTYAGLLTVGYTLTGGTRTTVGVSESPASSGIYHATITFADGFSGQVVWDTGTIPTAYAVEDVAPPPVATGPGVIEGPVIYPTGTRLSQVYCSDEDIALRAMGDYTMICPQSQVLAHPTDGVFAPGSPWMLSSASSDFVAQGVHAANVILLSQPRSVFKNSGDLLAIDSVSTSSLTLRRLGAPSGRGQHPAPAAGLTAVEGTVLTFDPQIDTASFDLNRTFGIDPNVVRKTPSDLYEPRDLQQYATLLVLGRAYAIQVKTREGDFTLKLAEINRELQTLRERISVRWGTFGRGDVPTRNAPTRVRLRR